MGPPASIDVSSGGFGAEDLSKAHLLKDTEGFRVHSKPQQPLDLTYVHEAQMVFVLLNCFQFEKKCW
jgi:hypothetical protein